MLVEILRDLHVAAAIRIFNQILATAYSRKKSTGYLYLMILKETEQQKKLIKKLNKLNKLNPEMPK